MTDAINTRFCTECGHRLLDMTGQESWGSRHKDETLCGVCWKKRESRERRREVNKMLRRMMRTNPAIKVNEPMKWN